MSEEPIKVLLIEDNPGDIRLIREMLAEVKGATFHLECTDRLKIGLERLAKGGIDVVLLDLALPESQGLDTFARAKAGAPGVPIVVLTALDDEILGIKAVQAGAQDYLVKGQVSARLLSRSIRYGLERKRAEEALRRSEESLVEAQRVAHLGNWDWDIKNNELRWSDEIYRIFGLAPQEFVPTYEGFLNSVHPADREFVKELVDEALYEKKPYSIDHRIILPNGEERIVHEQGEVTFDETGTPIRMVGTVHDITERRHLERQIVYLSGRARRRIGQDLHDGLGQHLTGIAFMSKVLEQKLAAKSLAEAADVREIVKLVNQAINETRRLARGLAPVDLSADGLMLALQEFAANVEKLSGISCDFKCEKPVLTKDHFAALNLYRIAEEAVDNAIKHGKAKHILIGLSSVNDRTTLTVKDDGVGIPEGWEKSKSMGLNIIKYRTRQIGASFDIKRDAGGGTIVTCSFQDISDKK